MVKKILITGGTGLIGRKLTHLLLENDYQVVHVSRSKGMDKSPQTFTWDPRENYLDSEALNGVDAIINLAGAGLADKKWSESYKKVILESRIKSTNLLFERLQKSDHRVKVFLSASAVGIYPDDRGNQVFYEDSGSYATNFLAEVTRAWEQEADKISTLGIRTVKFRIGVVLSKSGGALSKMMIPIKLGLGAPLGNGQQYMSWIHELDLCRMFALALEDENLKGVYNAVSPDVKTNSELTRGIAKFLNKPYFFAKYSRLFD